MLIVIRCISAVSQRSLGVRPTLQSGARRGICWPDDEGQISLQLGLILEGSSLIPEVANDVHLKLLVTSRYKLCSTYLLWGFAFPAPLQTLQQPPPQIPRQSPDPVLADPLSRKLAWES